MSSSLTLETFDCQGDPTSVGARWERWKRALFIYLEAASIEVDTKKRASLLHFGGLDLQDIFYNIPGANVASQDEVDVFEIAIAKLDEYFTPKQSKVYERHLFRLLKQEPNEKFEKFLVQLRKQAEKCQFSNAEEHIIDQITEKGASVELRKKILKIGDQITLDQIITEANTLEAVSKQLEQYNCIQKNETVNKIDIKPKTRLRVGTGCTRCGSQKHNASTLTCPAKGKECHKCGLKNHFRQYCRSSLTFKRKNEDKDKKESEKKKYKREPENKNDQKKARNDNVNQISNTKEQEDTYYVFHIDDDVEFDCTIGGVKTKLLVDSGCKKNLITEKTWEIMKSKEIKVFHQVANPDVNFLAYGSNTPLKVKGSFQARLQVGSRTEDATFYVIKNGSKDLLGKTTAMGLGILKIGLDLETNHIESEPFPKFKKVLVDLPIDDSVPPVSQPYRRIPVPLEGKIDAKIEELVKRDIIEEVKGPSRWVSPIVPAMKENGEVRLCVDMRRANKAIIRENHPLPIMDTLLPKVRNAKIFTKLDIKDAFHQIEIHPDSRYITTFITHKGLFRYKRLMFGISCAPEIFQKTLERMLLGCEGVINYIDDILIYGKDLKEHDERLDKVLAILKFHQVVLNKEKCLFREKTINFLGHELSEHGVRPLQKYISTIQKFRPPTTIGELRSFLGLVNFVSKWIPNFATRADPLRELLRNKKDEGSNITDSWETNQQEAFEVLKTDLINIPTLGYYNANDRTVVIADASPVGLGSVLVQVNDKGPRIIAYGHKTLTDCERRYCQTEKEALALVWAVEHFHVFLYGKTFELVTDHKPLEVIFGPKSKPCARIERWILRLQSYQYKVVYQPGKSNIADPLSRLCDIPKNLPPSQDNFIHQIVEYIRPVAVPLKEIIEASLEDDEIRKVKEGLYSDKWEDQVKRYKIIQSELCFYEGILLRGTRIVIPAKLRSRVLSAAHEGHPGIVGMKARLRTKVWWPKYDREAERLVKNCKGCTLVSAPQPPNPLKRRELPQEPWADIAMDLMGPLPSGDNLLVVVDYFSRYKEIKICRRITSSDIISHLSEIFSRLGNPTSITADNGKQFCSEEFKLFCSERNITLFNTIPYFPQMNGEVERQNRDILKRLKIAQLEKKKLQQCLEEYLVMYNSTPHSVTGKTPSELFFNRKFRDKIPMIGDVEQNSQAIEVKDRDQEIKEKGKIYADRKRKAKDHNLEPGDKVYVKKMTKENKISLNFDETPHTVEKSTGGDFEIRNDETGQVFRRNIVHLKKVEGEWKVVMNKEGEEETRSDLNKEITEN